MSDETQFKYIVWLAGKPESAIVIDTFREMSYLVNSGYGKLCNDYVKYFCRVECPINPELSPEDIARDYETY